jgi:hypothetical protein
MKKLYYILLAILLLSLFFISCEDEKADNNTDKDPRNHVWVVDQNGIEVSIEATWKVTQNNHPNSTTALGTLLKLPRTPAPVAFSSEGNITDPDGIMWTKVYVKINEDLTFWFLRRVDTSLEPNQLYSVKNVDSAGNLETSYGEYPFEAPEEDLIVYEKQ